jgi:hypothetical protein
MLIYLPDLRLCADPPRHPTPEGGGAGLFSLPQCVGSVEQGLWRRSGSLTRAVAEARSVVPSNGYGATISLQVTFDYGARYSGGSTLLTSPPLVSMRKDLPTRWCAAEEVSLSVGRKSRGGGGAWPLPPFLAQGSGGVAVEGIEGEKRREDEAEGGTRRGPQNKRGERGSLVPLLSESPGLEAKLILVTF